VHFDGVAKGHARVVVGWEAKALDVLARIIGPRYQRVTAVLVSPFAPWARDRGDAHRAVTPRYRHPPFYPYSCVIP